MKWDTNLNLPKEQLAFVFGDNQICALHKGKEVNRHSLNDLVFDIKLQCSNLLPTPVTFFFSVPKLFFVVIPC